MSKYTQVNSPLRVTQTATLAGPTSIGGGATLCCVSLGSASEGEISLGGNATATLGVTVTGARADLPNFAGVDLPATTPSVVLGSAKVTATDSITIRLHNTSNQNSTVPTATYRAVVLQFTA